MQSFLKELLRTIPVNIESLIRSEDIALHKNATKEEIGRGINRSSGVEADNIGQIRKTADGGYQILILGSDHYYRKRFTMAHELGHYMLHKDKIDRLGSIADSEDYEGMDADEEKEANFFAAETLMPEDKVREIFSETMRNQRDNETLAIEEMAKMFQVSRASMNIRLQLLGLINKYPTN